VVAIRALTFDYGGTLDGEASHWLDRFIDLYREAGVELPFENVKKAFYHADDLSYADPRIAKTNLRELMDFHVGIQLDVLGIADPGLRTVLVERFVALTESALNHSRGILERLAGRYQLGVISNFYGNVERILTDAGFTPLLSAIIDSNVVGMSKPDRRIFDLAVAELGVPAAETLHIGDSYERDVVAARAAGLKAVWLVGPDNARKAKPRDGSGDVCVRSLDEFVVYLDRMDGIK